MTMKQNSKIHIRDFPKEKKWVLCNILIQRCLVSANHYSIVVDQHKISLKVEIVLMSRFLLALFKVIYYFFLQFFIIKNQNIKDSKVIFLQAGNGYETHNLSIVTNYNESEVIILNAFEVKSYMGIIKVNFLTLINAFIYSMVNYYSVVRQGLPSSIESMVMDDGPKNIVRYSYLLSFFRTIKKSNNNIQIYTGGSWLQSNAAIESNLKTFCLLHGLLGRVHPIVFPKFSGVYVYNADEKSYLEGLGIKSNIHIYPFDKVHVKCRVVLIFMRLNDELMDFNDLYDLVQFFKTHNYDIKMKLHPQYRDKNAYEWASTLSIDIIGSNAEDATSLIYSFSPSFIVAWKSTALCESLNIGVIPISLSKKSEVLSRPVYPFDKRTLSWHDDKKQIISAVNQQADYCKILRALTN